MSNETFQQHYGPEETALESYSIFVGFALFVQAEVKKPSSGATLSFLHNRSGGGGGEGGSGGKEGGALPQSASASSQLSASVSSKL